MNTVIVGVGNEFQGDDGIGRHIARNLKSKQLESITIKEESGEATSLMEAWTGADQVIIIDAMVSGKTPGTVSRFDATDSPLPKDVFPHFSSHTFSVAESIELARALNRLPQEVIVYGIEGKNFQSGFGLSPELKKIIDEVSQQVLRDLNRKHA